VINHLATQIFFTTRWRLEFGRAAIYSLFVKNLSVTLFSSALPENDSLEEFFVRNLIAGFESITRNCFNHYGLFIKHDRNKGSDHLTSANILSELFAAKNYGMPRTRGLIQCRQGEG